MLEAILIIVCILFGIVIAITVEVDVLRQNNKRVLIILQSLHNTNELENEQITSEISANIIDPNKKDEDEEDSPRSKMINSRSVWEEDALTGEEIEKL